MGTKTFASTGSELVVSTAFLCCMFFSDFDARNVLNAQPHSHVLWMELFDVLPEIVLECRRMIEMNLVSLNTRCSLRHSIIVAAGGGRSFQGTCQLQAVIVAVVLEL